MKKLMSKASVLALTLSALMFYGCATTNNTAKSNAEKTTVAEQQQVKIEALSKVSQISKYGNCTLSITEDEFKALGFEVGDVVVIKAANFETQAPVGTNYSDVDRGNYIVKVANGSVEVAINMGNFAKTSESAVETPVSISLKEKGAYLQQYQIRQLKKSENREDYASDQVFANFRNVAMADIAQGKLYRSCNPVYTDARAPYADKLASEHGIKTVINLADTTESASANFEKAPYYKSLSDNGNVVYLNMGVSFSDADFVEKLHTGLSFLAAHKDAPYLVHCNEGKDRAGFVVSILEAISGATLEQMTADYMVSFENYFGVQKGTQQYELIGKTIADQFKAINDGNAVSNDNVQSVTENYLLNTVKITQEELDSIKANLK